MEAIPRSPWEGLEIERSITHRRRPWAPQELELLFKQPLFAEKTFPSTWKAGGAASYWIPLLGLFTGARVGELAQLRRGDVENIDGINVISITDEGESQNVKTTSSVRKVPLHSALVDLGFLGYVESLGCGPSTTLWPALRLREGKSGGYFSQWFGEYRRGLGLGKYPDFHCFRHTMRTALADAEVAEPTIDALLGHEASGSTGARVYTHRTLRHLRELNPFNNVPQVRLNPS
jgi:integrase